MTEDRQKTIENLFMQACNEIAEGIPDYHTLETEMSKLKLGGAIQYSHLESIADKSHWPSFYKWYSWPAEEQITDELKKTEGIFMPLRGYSAIPGEVSNLDQEVFKVLFDIFHHTELVSIILRLVDPKNYAIYSPPVAYQIMSLRGRNYSEEYMNYLKQIRVLRREFKHERTSDTDMFIWASAHIRLEIDPVLKEAQDMVIDHAIIENMKRLIPVVVRDKSNLEVANYFYRAEIYGIASKFAAIAFEEAVNKGMNRIPKAFIFKNRLNPSANTLEKKIPSIASFFNINEFTLHAVRHLRNDASHPNPEISKKGVKIMIETTTVLINKIKECV
jgi:hypothetical protein